VIFRNQPPARDLAQAADHIRDDGEIEILEGSAPLRAEPVH
jgi:hypothetical protein